MFSNGSDENDILENTIENNLVGVYFNWELGLDRCFNNHIDYNHFNYNSYPWAGVPDDPPNVPPIPPIWYVNNDFGPNNQIVS